jgi:hypothetical protein
MIALDGEMFQMPLKARADRAQGEKHADERARQPQS